MQTYRHELSGVSTMHAMKNDDLHFDPRVQQARMSVARQLFAHQVDHLKAAKAAPQPEDGSPAPRAPGADTSDDERTHAVAQLTELLAARPRYGSRRGHYLPYGLRAAAGR